VGLSFGGAADTGGGDEEGHTAKVGGLVGFLGGAAPRPIPPTSPRSLPLESGAGCLGLPAFLWG